MFLIGDAFFQIVVFCFETCAQVDIEQVDFDFLFDFPVDFIFVTS